MFIPLKKKYFEQFARGEKREEFRLLGPRWNERTCFPGRAVTLICGYSGARIEGVVNAFRVSRLADVPGMTEVYPGMAGDTLVAAIGITIPSAR